MQLNINLYHELRKENPSRARELVRKVLKQNRGNISKTARVLGIDRKTVRRARDGTVLLPKNQDQNFRKFIESSMQLFCLLLFLSIP